MLKLDNQNQKAKQSHKKNLEMVQEIIDMNSQHFSYTKFSNLSTNEYKIDEVVKKVVQNFIEVRDCVNLKSNKLCQIQFVKKCMLNEETANLLINEIEVTKELNHPNLIKLQDVF